MPDTTASPLPRTTESWIAEMPKAELHLHLDGSLRPETALHLARTRQPLPGARPMGLAALPDGEADLPGHLEGMRARLAAPERCADQSELLRAFDLPVALLQDAEALERAAFELVEDVSGDGTRYAEIRWAPALHTARGLSLRDGIAAVASGAARGGRETGTLVRLIAVAMRTHEPGVAVDVARAAAAFLPEGLVGFDLAGREREAPDPRRFAEAFGLAREQGLGITCHAGEWGGPEGVWRALEVEPWRIAHGSPAADDAALLRALVERGVTLDMCPSSNVQAGVVEDLAGHPLPRLARAGVAVTLSTDDRTVSDLTLVREYGRAMSIMGLGPSEMLGIARQAYLAAFLHHDEALRARLLADFEAWAAGHPAPDPWSAADEAR